MTLAELRTLAWHTLACRSCGEPTGRRCVTSSGTRTVPHQPRMDDLNAWLSRQPEVDALTSALDREMNAYRAAFEELRAAEEQLQAKAKELQGLELQNADLAEQLSHARADYAGLLVSTSDTIDELMAQVAEAQRSLIQAAAQSKNDQTTIVSLRAEIARLKAELPGTNPPPVPGTPDTPAGYKLLRKFDLSKNEGWVLETGKPSNADGVDRPANVKFGAGPEGKSMELLINREGSTVYTCDAKATFQPIPNYHRVRCVIEKEATVPGVWPGIPWERPLGGGEGEIDIWETFPANAAKGWPVDAGTLHTTPYDTTHKQLQRRFPDMSKAGRYVLEFELAPGRARWWVNGTMVEATKAQFDAATGGRWDAMYGQASKNWYLRMTQQAGGIGGGPIPATFDQWRVWVHELSVFVPEK